MQSTIGDTYKDARVQLMNGRRVLFSGTPCQIEGLNLYLQNKGAPVDSLITVEVICHGTPSPKLYEKYIEEMENKLGDCITGVFFRDEIGGRCLIMRIEAKNGTTYRREQTKDSYYRMFLNDTCLRESCYQCSSRGLKKRADITLSDIWGVENVSPDLVDGEGLSLSSSTALCR